MYTDAKIYIDVYRFGYNFWILLNHGCILFLEDDVKNMGSSTAACRQK